MLYLIDKKYYIKISPSIYKEVKMELANNGDVVLKPIGNKKEFYSNDITVIDFQQEKNNFKKKLEDEQLNKENVSVKKTSKYSKYK